MIESPPAGLVSRAFNSHWLVMPLLTVLVCLAAGYLLMWAYQVYQSPEILYLLESLNLCG